MNLKQAILNNTGMQQDLSISKGNNDFAYKNLNIRIQSTNDSTLASITNIKSPKQVTSTNMQGKVLNSILCNEYIVVFTHSETTDYIYRIDLENPDNPVVNVLFQGNLNFSYDNPIDSIFFFENNNVQKVYWVDGWRNLPRVINIITEGERNGADFNTYDPDTVFDFYPELKGSIPEITAVKNFEVESEIPAGVVQYFVSYYNNNSSESLIAASSFLYNVDLKDRGANADSKGCAFYVTISNVENVNYEYLRLYAVRRTSLDGECITTIVKDFKITSGITVYTALDQGIGQETLDASQIFFIGGSPIFAKTLCYKDNTLFMGGIRTKGVVIDDDIKEAIGKTIDRTEDPITGDLSFAEALILKEDYKTISPNTVNIGNYYPYKLQKDLESIDYKTYKVGEVYRFGIQFQGKYGQWSEVVWIGDKRIQNRPTYNDGSNTFNVSNISFGNSGLAVEDAYKKIFSKLRDNGFINYRLLIADPETTNGRSILAQGVVCPTMFTPKLRSENAPHTINSWIMRPRNGRAANHHLEALHSANQPGGELSTYDARYKIGKYVYVGLTDTIHVGELDIHNLPFEFKRSDLPNYKNRSNMFFIDESILGLYSPELTSDSVLSQQPKFRIIGYTPLTVNYSDADLTTQNIGISLGYTPFIIKGEVANYRVGFDEDSIIKPLYSGDIYLAPGWQQIENDWTNTIEAWETDRYTIHMWQHSRSVIGFDTTDDRVRYTSGGAREELSQEPLVLKNSYFYNHLFSTNNVYLPNSIDYNVEGVKLCKEDSESFDNNFNKIYYKSFDYVSTNESARIYSEKIKSNNSWKGFKESSRITFNSIPHAVFYLGEDSENHLEILPNFRHEYPYNGIFTGKYSRYNTDTATEWKDISDEQYNPNNILSILNKIFTNKINSVGTTIGAGWIDDFVKYTDATVKDVYDADSTPRYKTLCAVPRDAFPESASDDPDDFPLHVYPPDEDVVPDPGFGPPYKNPLIPNWLSNYDYTDDNSLPDGNDPDGEPWQGRDWKIIILYASSINKAYKVAFRLLNNGSQIQIVKLPLDHTDGTGDLTQAYPYLTESNYRVWKGIDDPQGAYAFVAIGSSDGTGSNIKYESSLKKVDTSNPYRYTQRHIDIEKPSAPYLFMGELYYDIEYKYLYGGYSKDSLDKLNWIPISKAVKIPEASDNFYTIEKTEGDTYYQRWDCLKTFPKTTEDMNNVVDITSFMVETHINLDERTDVNRGNFNMFVRPETFNLFNPVYSQKNNLFSYSTLNSLFSEVNENQVIWSQAKNFLGNVDTWTGINAVNFTNLKYPVTKLVNFNNKVLGLTEKSVEIINFNAKNMIPTTDNTAIELKNSAKVDGTIDFSVGKGSTNPSVLVTEKGFYFIEDNENSLIRIEYDGSIKNIALGKMDSWFKNNIVPGNHLANPNAFVLSYDAKNKDVYIANNSDVLVYNETLENFTSFVDFQELLSLYTHKGNVFALAHTYENNVERTDLFKLYGGDTYGYGFYGKPLPYSIQYRVNPGPYTDKVFTNIELKADLGATSINSNTSNVKPFDTIQVWNEYQDTGEQPLLYDRLSSLRDKFRTWRAIIPRNKKGDRSTWRDRIRNPWVHLKLDNTNVNGQKLEFHNIAVTYME